MSLRGLVDRIDEQTAVVAVSGPLTLGTNLKILDTQMQELVADGVTRLVVDLGESAYADSSGLGLLVHAYGLVNERRGAIRLCGVSERIASLLRMTKADGFLPSDADRAASLAALG